MTNEQLMKAVVVHLARLELEVATLVSCLHQRDLVLEQDFRQRFEQEMQTHGQTAVRAVLADLQEHLGLLWLDAELRRQGPGEAPDSPPDSASS